MKYHVTTLCRFAIVTIMVNFSYAQDESSEPIELTRLREQFSNRIEQEMKPWRDRYAQELQKLEDRLIKDRKLTEALAVKKEKENHLNVDFGVNYDKEITPIKQEEIKKQIINTVWFLYEFDDIKKEKQVDTYHFMDENSIYILSAKKKFPWKQISKKKISIQYISGDIDVDLNFGKESEISYLGKKYKFIYVGSVPKK